MNPRPGSGAIGQREYEGSELDLFAHATRWKAYWASVIGPFVGSHVLDVGAGIGATASALREAPCDRWLALEPDPALCDRMQGAILSGELPARVEVRTGTTHELAPEESFDTILYIDVLEHIEDDRSELERAARHLNRGGNLIVLAPAHNWLYTPFDRAIGHHRRYTRKSLLSVKPERLKLDRMFYLDSVGMLASLGNRLLLRKARPTLAQIEAWDKIMVPISRLVDPMFAGRLGKSVVAVFST